MIKYFKIIIFIFLVFTNKTFNANEVLMYADSITYDSKKNIIAKGNAKIISENRIIQSNIIIYNKSEDKFILPKDFNFKDEGNNYYYGTSGHFDKDLTNAEINDVKILLSDGSRIVGKKAIKKNKIDLIDKGSYSPCTSRIIIKDFICPIWQIEGEKILHDNENLFLYQKHGKLKILNTPVFYLPYLVSPSPLRKKRKSGFLAPTLNINFLNTKSSQSASFPYYFNLDIDKELIFTPVFHYGGGVNSSQRFLFDYNQLISGGNLNTKYSMDTTLENENNERWLKNASLITSYKKNINEKFNINLESALQTSRNYIQSSDPNNKLSYAHSLSTSLDINGYNLNNKNDHLFANITTFQATQFSENNKTTPKILPFIQYDLENINNEFTEINNRFEFYNIVRESNTSAHAENQQKLSHLVGTENELFNFNSKIKIKSSLYNQFFVTKNKQIDSVNHSNDYYRIFPIIGIFFETPFNFKKSNIIFNPKLSFVGSSGQSNSNKISNENSTNNRFDINNQVNLNRYSGSDKMDNSKRVISQLEIQKNNLKFQISQNYEFTDNSNYHLETGNKNNLSDTLGSATFQNEKIYFGYELRYNHENNLIPRQKISIEQSSNFGKLELSYIEEKSYINKLLTKNTETINYSYKTNKIKKFNEFNIEGSYNAGAEKNNEYSLGYSYFDECFGINIDFKRKDYISQNIKPADILTITFSFKSLGAYKSSNLAVSEQDKQEIEWIGLKNNEKLFN